MTDGPNAVHVLHLLVLYRCDDKSTAVTRLWKTEVPKTGTKQVQQQNWAR